MVRGFPARRSGKRMATFKLIYFVPEEARDATRDACFAAGGGRIGDYERCSWYTLGTGTFLAGEDADPAIGRVGEEEHVREYRVEMVVAEENQIGRASCRERV